MDCMGASYPSLLLLFLSAWLLVSSHSLLPVLASTTVKHLPGFHGPLPFHLETGYVVVDELYDSKLFYYFLKSERNPSEDPLILWLTGGPRCSVLSAIAFENGPFGFEKLEYNGSLPTLLPRPYSWTKIANIIYLDSPVGSGFSFSRKPEGYVVGDRNSSQHVAIFLQKWFTDHHEFLSNPFYIAGDSYAGKMTPIITHVLSEGIQTGQSPPVNLQGYIIGNPVTDHNIVRKGAAKFAYGHGLISYELYESITKRCEGENYVYPSRDCAQKLKVVKDLEHILDKGQILDPCCDDVTYVKSVTSENGIGGGRYMRESSYGLQQSKTLPDLRCQTYGYYLCQQWANFEISRKALNIEKGSPKKWVRCNLTLPYTEDIASAIDYFSILAKKGYRALVYSGDLDMMAPFTGTDESLRSFNWSIVDDWRPWMVDDITAGFTRTYSSRLTFATVKGAGHTAPEYKPRECFAMLSRWISGEPL